MKVQGIKMVAQNLGRVIQNNSPTLLTGLSVAGLVTTAVLAVKATPKALRILEERRAEESQKNEDFIEFTKTGIIKETWKCYVPALVMGTATIACIIGANSINLRRNAALASVYSLTETTLKEYQAKVVETLGREKVQTIKESIHKDKVIQNPTSKTEVIITGKGEMLCYDVFSGRYFKSDIENLRKVENELNRDLLDDLHISLNDVYYAMGLSNVKLGEELGWAVNDGLIEMCFSSQLSDEGVPCIVVDYHEGPIYNFRSR